jgi:hypothetical protein
MPDGGESFGFHFFRLNQDGYWSHKHGFTPSQNTDEDGATIVDPRQASTGDFSDFLGFWWVNRAALRQRLGR